MENHKIPEKILLQAIQQSLQYSQPPPARRNDSDQDNDSDSSEVSKSSSESESSKNSNRRNNQVRVFRAQEAVTNFLISTDPNFQALHDALLIQLFLIALFTLVRDSYHAGSLFLDTSFFRMSIFGSKNDILNFLVIELSIQAWGLVIHPLFKVWQISRSTAFPKLVDGIFVMFYLSYLLIGFLWTVHVLAGLEVLPRITTLIASVEQFRITMKSYSFIRENAYKVLYPWHKDDTSGPAVWYRGQMSPTVGSFSQYCYFLFAPTLLYRDHYPRTSGRIRWNAVVMYCIQMFVAIWCGVFIATNILYPPSLSERDVVHCAMLCLIMGLVGLMLGSIVVLHAYMNLAAEIMRFSDRKFYDAWWTCTSFSSFYRKWNLLVHDWIHSYVYTDMRKVFSKRVSVFCTILVSSLVHEYLLAMGMGFVLPVITILFAGVGVFFYVLKPLDNHRMSNLFILVCLSLGTAMIICVLLLETASRQYCPPRERNWFSPQLMSCYYRQNNITL